MTGRVNAHPPNSRVIAVGGTGIYGRGVVRLLAASPVVSHVVIASRDLGAAESLAAGLGDKVSAARADVRDNGALAGLAADADLVVNMAGPDSEVVLPALRQAIAAGTHYCDLCADGRIAEQARLLDSAARTRGVTALVGAGIFPGLSNLTMLHASRQLDLTEELRHTVFCVVALDSGGPWCLLPRWRKAGRVDASWQAIMHSFANPVRVLRDGRIEEVKPLQAAVCLTLPQGLRVNAYPVGFSEPITLPQTLPELRRASSLWSFFPPELNEIACTLGERLGRGELDESAAALEFHEHLTAQPRESLDPPAGYNVPWVTWAEATGLKDGQRASYSCWPRGDWPLTEVVLCTAALMILRGELTKRGVVAPESCLEPLPFFSGVAALAGWKDSAGGLLGESFRTVA